MKFSVLIIAAALACVGSALASDNELFDTPLFKEEGVSAQQRALLHKKVKHGHYGGCVAPKEVFYIASNAATKYAYFRDRVLAKALRIVYKKYGYKKPQVSYGKTKHFHKHAGKVQIKLVAKYPISNCHKRAQLREAVTAVVKHYASHYKSMM